MPCKTCKPAVPAPRQDKPPCPSCVDEHLRLAMTTGDRQRDRYRAYWHLAHAAAMSAEPLRGRLIAARIAWQREKREPNWSKLVDAATITEET